MTARRLKLTLMMPLIFLVYLVSFLSISACSSENSTSVATDTASPSAKQEADDIECNIKNTYARLAAERKDICPKLVQKDIGSSTIKRKNEVMVDNYCDYFLYPDAGQQITVDLDSSQIEALLIVPTIHNFANGKYRVASYDKHVIRLTYDGVAHKPKRLNYDVSITIID
ncbi:hypothetical protein [uncultured Psychrobacter sp.]|uniref:hypothetical protein n=1 Tax=uncultured Psychrobacter sp. TaxID=259303 RepID=UPI003457EB3B